MQALILAGGEGTRLRPLTSTVPEAGRPAGRPAVHRVHARLAAPHGVDDVVMSCGHLADGVRNVLGDGESRSASGCATWRSRGRSAPAAR